MFSKEAVFLRICYLLLFFYIFHLITNTTFINLVIHPFHKSYDKYLKLDGKQ